MCRGAELVPLIQETSDAHMERSGGGQIVPAPRCDQLKRLLVRRSRQVQTALRTVQVCDSGHGEQRRAPIAAGLARGRSLSERGARRAQVIARTIEIAEGSAAARRVPAI